MTFTCLHCGSPFSSTKRWARYCTAKCRNGYNNPRRKPLDKGKPAAYSSLSNVVA